MASIPGTGRHRPRSTSPRSRTRSRSSWTATAAGPTEHGVSVADGHRAGSRALRPVVEAAIDLGIESLAVYAFSTENWSRSPDEVARADGDLRRDDRPGAARPRRAGRPLPLPRPPRPRSRLAAREDGRARGGDGRQVDSSQLWIAFDYGGRAELVDAARRLRRERRRPRRGRRGRARRVPLRARDAGSRPRDPHLRRAAHLELPALAVRVRRVRLHRHALARLRAGRAAGRDRGVREPAP